MIFNCLIVSAFCTIVLQQYYWKKIMTWGIHFIGLLFLCICRWTAVVLRLRCGCLSKTALFPDPERSRNFPHVPRGNSSTAAPKTAVSSGYRSLSETAGSSCCTTCSPRKGAWDTVQKVWLQISCADCSFYLHSRHKTQNLKNSARGICFWVSVMKTCLVHIYTLRQILKKKNMTI